MVWIAPAGAQQFTGGVRGAVRDANGVIPGVAVTLTNEATNIAREVVTNDVGQYNFPARAARHLHAEGRSSPDSRPTRSKGIVVGTQQFVTLDVALEVGAIEENVTVTGQSPLIDTSIGVDRRRARQGDSRRAAGARPQRVPDRHHRPDVHADRRPAVQPAAGPDQRLDRLARRRRHARQ